ncbi:hypothetical protein CDAR_290381 [Caerostris darwini]|uniref:Uncharacterized protein n=1 Tax=Caerostris darwini TaxID=1538125 RepID=A0AAV4N3K0_9ARAC|nr:hypothetical protein CDAR_290381 [Caerostris darwini]
MARERRERDALLTYLVRKIEKSAAKIDAQQRFCPVPGHRSAGVGSHPRSLDPTPYPLTPYIPGRVANEFRLLYSWRVRDVPCGWWFFFSFAIAETYRGP